MLALTRRAFLAHATAGLALSTAPLGGKASPRGIPIGLQLYTLAAQLREDFEGTLDEIAAIGIREVELIAFPERKPADVRRALAQAGLTPVAIHLGGDALLDDTRGQLDTAAALGATCLVCPEPLISPAARTRPEFAGRDSPQGAAQFVASLTLDDWLWNAEMLNTIGAAAQRAGIRFGYHNHSAEFRSFGTRTAYDELIARTEPRFVTFEMDCGWVESSRASAVTYLRRYPGRFQLLHLKDIKRRAPAGVELSMTSTEVGSGIIDWRAIFAAAPTAGVQHCFIEQEPPFDRAPLEAVRRSYEWLQRLK